MTRRRPHRLTVAALCLLAALAACSSSRGKPAAGPDASGDSGSTTTTAAPATRRGLRAIAPCAVSAAQARVPQTTSVDAKGDVTLDGRSHTTKVPLEMVAFSARPGASVTLQLVATTVAYAKPRLGGHIDFDRIHLELPVVEADPG